MPYVTEVDGIPSWVVEGNVIKTARGGCVIDKDDNKFSLADGFEGRTPIERYHPAAYDPVARVELLDKVGISAQVVYPNAVGIGGDKLTAAVQDERQRLLLLQMFNDYNAEVMSPRRIDDGGASGSGFVPRTVCTTRSPPARTANSARTAALRRGTSSRSMASAVSYAAARDPGTTRCSIRVASQTGMMASSSTRRRYCGV